MNSTTWKLHWSDKYWASAFVLSVAPKKALKSAWVTSLKMEQPIAIPAYKPVMKF